MNYCARPAQLSLLLESFVPLDGFTPRLASHYGSRGRQLLGLMLDLGSKSLEFITKSIPVARSHYHTRAGWEDEEHDEVVSDRESL